MALLIASRRARSGSSTGQSSSRGRPRDAAQHAVDEARAAAVGDLVRLLDRLVDGGVGRHAVEEQELIGGDPQRRVQRRLDLREGAVAGARRSRGRAGAASAGSPSPARAAAPGRGRRSAAGRCRGRSRPAPATGASARAPRRRRRARCPGGRCGGGCGRGRSGGSRRRGEVALRHLVGPVR